MTPIELIAAALRDEPAPWPADATPGLEGAVIERAASHGVAALLAMAPAVDGWPDVVGAALKNVLRCEAASEVITREALSRTLAALAAVGVRALMLKGAPLAYTHYPRPWLRPRTDADLLVAPGDRQRADGVLQDLGYRPGTDYAGELVTHQFMYERPGRCGVADVVDLHWKIANPHAFADALTFDELDVRSVPVPALGPEARGLSDIDTLLIACVHRAAHHYNSDRLIWLYDIHVLLGAMTAERRDLAADLARRKGLGAVCASAIGDARTRFKTRVTDDWLNGLGSGGLHGEPAAFLRNGRTKAHILFSDLRALPGWRPRLSLIRQHLFPPAAYIRRAYTLSNPALLPLAYTHRIVTGVAKWVRRH